MKWEIPNMWEDGECWIIGGGSSVPRMFGVPEDIIQDVYKKRRTLEAYSPYLSALHDKHVIGVNTAYQYGNWVDITVFGDINFYLEHTMKLLDFKNLKVSCHPRVRKGHPGVYHIKYIAQDSQKTKGLTTRKGYTAWNKHTGAVAINLAYHLGVKRVYLLGFDMQLDTNGKAHSHAEYHQEGLPIHKNRLPYDSHLSHYPYIARDAESMGLEIINVNDNTAITQFPVVKLEDVL
jgi:hypothetical protein